MGRRVEEALKFCMYALFVLTSMHRSRGTECACTDEHIHTHTDTCKCSPTPCMRQARAPPHLVSVESTRGHECEGGRSVDGHAPSGEAHVRPLVPIDDQGGISPLINNHMRACLNTILCTQHRPPVHFWLF